MPPPTELRELKSGAINWKLISKQWPRAFGLEESGYIHYFVILAWRLTVELFRVLLNSSGDYRTLSSHSPGLISVGFCPSPC